MPGVRPASTGGARRPSLCRSSRWAPSAGCTSRSRRRLEDPVFEKAFEVYGTDQIESRFILTPDFMERLLGLERTFQGKQLRCAFAGGEMFLAVAGKNLLESGSMHRRMDDLGRVRE